MKSSIITQTQQRNMCIKYVSSTIHQTPKKTFPV